MIIITDIAEQFERVVRHFNSIDSLSHATREVSVQHARDILERLRFLAEEGDAEERKFDLDESRLETSEMLLTVAKAFLGCMAELARKDREKLADKEASPVFEKTVDAIGKIGYRVRTNVINLLIKQGKGNTADEMRSKLESTTPERFKVSRISGAEILRDLEAGLFRAEMLEKKAAGLPDRKGTMSNEACNIVSSVGGYHTIIEVSEKGLIPAVQEVILEQEKSYGRGKHKVYEVSKEELIPAAQEANKGQDKGLDDPKLSQGN